MTRCKIGDLAIIRRGHNINRDKLVKVVERSDLPPVDGSALWVVQALSPLMSETGARVPVGAAVVVQDDNLQPIRAQPGADETISWVGRPGRELTPQQVDAIRNYQRELAAYRSEMEKPKVKNERAPRTLDAAKFRPSDAAIERPRERGGAIWEEWVILALFLAFLASVLVTGVWRAQ